MSLRKKLSTSFNKIAGAVVRKAEDHLAVTFVASVAAAGAFYVITPIALAISPLLVPLTVLATIGSAGSAVVSGGTLLLQEGIKRGPLQ